MIHDPLCPYGHLNLGPCANCTYINEIRADERAKAWVRVIKLCAHTKHSASSPCIHDTCAEAARGET